MPWRIREPLLASLRTRAAAAQPTCARQRHSQQLWRQPLRRLPNLAPVLALQHSSRHAACTHHAVLRDEQVGALDVPVKDLLLVQVVQPVQKLHPSRTAPISLARLAHARSICMRQA